MIGFNHFDAKLGIVGRLGNYDSDVGTVLETQYNPSNKVSMCEL